MIFYSDKNVYEAAKDRIRWIFDEFPDRKIVVGFSGGKDSTTVLHLVKEIMDERGIKKIPVMFLDQELEAPQTIEYVREVMHRDWVEPYWIQSYFQEWNSSKGDWFNVWGPGEKWAREKEPDNPYINEDYKVKCHFKKVLDCVFSHHFGDNYICLGGVRIEESPNRRAGLTKVAFYKDITWGKGNGKGGYVFYPIWDWSVNDVWYYIISNNFPYCKIYNYYFTKKPLIQCRVSSFIHENAIQSLKEIKEIAPQFYQACLRRVENVNTTVQTLSMFNQYITELPQYFSCWDEYVYYLADHLIEKKENAESMKRSYDRSVKRWKKKFGNYQAGQELLYKVIGPGAAACIVAEDTEMSKLSNEEYKLAVYFNKNYAEIKKANRGNAEWVGK